MNPSTQPLSVGELCTRVTVIAHRKIQMIASEQQREQRLRA